MAAYSYKARDNAGKLMTGVLEAESEKDAVAQLRKMQYVPVKVEQGIVKAKAAAKTEARSSKAVAPGSAKPWYYVSFLNVKPTKVSVADMMVFCINLSSMVSSGIPLMGALDVIGAQMKNPLLGETVQGIARYVSEGSSLSDAMAKYPKVFSKLFVNMVRVGETSGTLEEVLRSLAIYMERQEDLRQKVQGALMYPMILLVAGAGVILVIMTFVLPKFVEIFLKSGVVLPLPTRVLYYSGTWMSKYWWLAGLVIATIFFSFRTWVRNPLGRAAWERIVLRTPVFGPLNADVLVARFTRTLGSLLNAGVPLLQGLDILKEVVDNSVFAKITQEVYESAEKGDGIARALGKRREFPADVVYMVNVGEQSGKMGLMLSRVAGFYENKVEFAIKGLVGWIEPIFISGLGIIVGGMLAAVLLPMFDMIKVIQR